MTEKSTSKNQTNDDLTKLIAELRQEMHIVRDELKALAGAAGSVARDELSAMKQVTPESAKEMLHKAEAAASAVAEKTKKRISTAEETVEAQAAEHPWRTLGIVGLAGFALGLLIRR